VISVKWNSKKNALHGVFMVQGYLVVAEQHALAEELHAKMGDDFRVIPLQSVAELADGPQERVAAVVIRVPADVASPDAAISAPALTGLGTLEAQVDELERRIISDSLVRNNHRRKETAIELGISRVTLYNKMKKFGML